MKDSIVPTTVPAPYTAQLSVLTRLARQIVLARLCDLQHGEIIIIENGSRQIFGRQTENCSLTVNVHIFDPRFYTDIAFGGSVGAGEAYMSGFWSCDDLTALIRIIVRNRDVLDDMETGFARLTVPLRKFFHFLHRNSKAGSRHNIAAHYDLGNDFFALFLQGIQLLGNYLFAQFDIFADRKPIIGLFSRDQILRTPGKRRQERQ